MTAQQWVGLGVRLFAIWLLLSAIQFAVMIPVALKGAGEYSNNASYFFAAVYAVAAVLLWVFPMAVANKLVPRTHAEGPLTGQAFDLARVGSAMLGLYFLASSGSRLVLFLLNTILFAGSASIYASMSSEGRLQLFVHGATVAIGLFLLLRSSSVARLVLGDRSDLR